MSRAWDGTDRGTPTNGTVGGHTYPGGYPGVYWEAYIPPPGSQAGCLSGTFTSFLALRRAVFQAYSSFLALSMHRRCCTVDAPSEPLLTLLLIPVTYRRIALLSHKEFRLGMSRKPGTESPFS